MAKAFSIEDGNLQNRTLITSRNRLYKDIDLTFTNKPSGDVYKKNDAAAVKQAVKNLLLTTKTEKPFQPFYGASLNNILFNLSEDFDDDQIKSVIANVISNYEPRALPQDIIVNLAPDSNSMDITVIFQIVNTTEEVQLDVTLTRLR